MPRQSKVRKVEQLLRRIERELNEKEFYPRLNVQLDLVLLALLSKSILTGKAVCALVQSGYHEEAFGLTRTLVDLYFTVRYISNKDSFDRAERFANFFARDYADWISIIQKYYPNKQLELPSHHSVMVALAKAYPNPHKWTGMGNQTRMMASEPSTQEKMPDGGPVDALFDYEILYKWTSHYVHPTVSALDTHAGEFGSKFYVHPRKADGKKFMHNALFNVVVLTAKIFICGMRGLGSSLSPRLSDEWDHLLRTL